MPYMITTHRPAFGEPSLAVANRSRRAVATLEEARYAAADAIREAARGSSGDFITPTTLVTRLPESGGTVGPLPDGTVIEVESATDQRLVDELPGEVRRVLWQRYPAAIPRAEIVLSWNAYNARS